MMARGSTAVRRKLALVWLLCVCLSSPTLSLTTISSSPPTGEDAFTTTTITTTTIASTTDETTSLAPSTERTSNAIPEEPLPKKHGSSKKHDSSSQSPPADQLDKPYPYLKKNSVADKEENAIRQAKRSGSDSLALNGTLQLSVVTKAPPAVETEATTEAETASTVSEEDTSTTTVGVDSTSAVTEEETTTRITRRTTETTASSEKSSVAETDTESVAPTTLSLSTSSSTSTMLASSTPVTSTTGTVPNSSVADTNVPTTGAESLPTTVYEEPPTTTLEAEPSTIVPLTTPALATLPPATTTSTTAEPTLTAASTRITSATTLLPATTLTTAPAPTTSTTTTTTTSTTTTTTTTTTTAKPTTTVSPRKVPATTLTPEPFSGSVTTVADEIPDTTTEVVSPTPAAEDVTLLVRILLDGSWQDVCSKLPILRESLTDLLNKNVEKKVFPRQIIFHQTQCSESLTPTSLVSDKQVQLLLYVVDENGNFDAKLTKIIPSLYESSPIDFPLTITSVSLVPEADSGNAIAVVIVSCVAFICLILLAGLLFIMRKRQGRFNYGERCRPVSLDAYSLDSVSAYNSVRRSKAVVRSSKRSYGNPAFEDSSVTPTHPLNFASLATFCNDTNAIAEEFVSIPQIHSKIEELPPGAEIKNRYANVIPLPETRVPLQKINNDPLSEYINASYVRGPKNATKYYIACQAPTETTVADFWRMIWEQQCKVIIMLTDLVENGVDKCTEYIPPLEVSDCHRLYGDYQVTLKKREAKEKYAISTLHLKNLENNTFREVSHIWYLWPASGVPSDAAGLIAVLLEARALQRGAAGPILVHCSPGTGRTGTLIALDLCIRQYEVTRTVDVPRVVYTIRRDRAGTVQTREQYIFIYKGLNLYANKLAGGGIDST